MLQNWSALFNKSGGIWREFCRLSESKAWGTWHAPQTCLWIFYYIVMLCVRFNIEYKQCIDQLPLVQQRICALNMCCLNALIYWLWNFAGNLFVWTEFNASEVDWWGDRARYWQTTRTDKDVESWGDWNLIIIEYGVYVYLRCAALKYFLTDF